MKHGIKYRALKRLHQERASLRHQLKYGRIIQGMEDDIAAEIESINALLYYLNWRDGDEREEVQPPRV